MVKLTDYIKMCEGQAAFARQFGIRPQRVTEMLKSKKPYLVTECGKVVQVCYEKVEGK